MLFHRHSVRKLSACSLSEHALLQTQHRRERPRLKWAASGCVRRFCVGDLRDMAESGVIQVFIKRREKTAARFSLRIAGTVSDAEPSFDEWPDQPRPDCALMIAPIALGDTAL